MSHHKGGHIKYFNVKHPSAAGTKTEQGASFCHQHFRKMQRKQPTHFIDKTNIQGNTWNNKSLSGSFITVPEGLEMRLVWPRPQSGRSSLPTSKDSLLINSSSRSSLFSSCKINIFAEIGMS